ncbi:MAG TPA: MBL fold metallo-hydrolase [Streptosporangiaceae bacterium]
MSHPATPEPGAPGTAEGDRHAWATSGIEDLGGGVHRIPLALPMAALKAVNVYALVDGDGIDLIDAGMAFGQAREQLEAALKQLGCELGDVGNFFITHVHRDHYTLAVELRRGNRGNAGDRGNAGAGNHGDRGDRGDRGRGTISLGLGEQANLAASRAMAEGDGSGTFVADLRRLGATELAPRFSRRGPGDGGPSASEWEEPDRWLDDGTELDVRSRKLRAINTPGHTRGHLVFHDAAAQTLFAGDHILPHITPTIGFEPARNRMALRDYIDSLRLILELPDARLLPAHGPVQDSTHKRVHELLAHHEQRLDEIFQAMRPGRSTAYEAAQALRWTRRQIRFGDLELINQLLATGETSAHLEVLVLRGQLARHTDNEGTDRYEVVSAATTRSAPA